MNTKTIISRDLLAASMVGLAAAAAYLAVIVAVDDLTHVHAHAAINELAGSFENVSISTTVTEN